MDSNNQRHSTATAEPQEDPGAYPIPFSTSSVKLGSRLDSVPTWFRYWAVSDACAGSPWYNDMVKANDRYEEWLSTLPPGEYPVSFRDGQRLEEIEDGLRRWAIQPQRSSQLWYNYFVRANARYEQHLAATRRPDEFAFPRGINHKYTDVPIKDVPQDEVWWALRPANRHQNWYQPLYDANERFLDDVYKSRSPGSEPVWFSKRYKGLRLDQVYARKGFIRWCVDPQRQEARWFYRFKDLLRRLEEWRLAHPERSGPRQRRKTPYIQNPVGEAIGPWDDSLGSADEDEDDKDSFVQSDSDPLEYSSGSDDDLLDDGGADNDISQDSDGSAGSSVEVAPPVRHVHKRSRTNVISSDEEESEEVGAFAGKLGRRYRVAYESSEEEVEAPAKKFLKRVQ